MKDDQMKDDQNQKVFPMIEETAMIEGQINVDPIKTDAYNSLIFNSIPFPFLIKSYSKRTALDR